MKDSFLKVKDLEVIYKTDLETVYAVNKISFDLAKEDSRREDLYDFPGSDDGAESGTDCGRSDR